MDVKCNSRTVERVDKKDDEARTLGRNEKSFVDRRESIKVHGGEIEKAVWLWSPEGCEVDAIIV